MAVRRGLSLSHLIGIGDAPIMDPLQENIGLVLSVLMLTGVILIRPIFTQRKRAEHALRESEEKFRLLFDESAVGNSLTTLDGEIRVNRAFCDMLGYPCAEMSDRTTWRQLTHPDDIPATEAAMTALSMGDVHSVRFEKRFLRKDGGVVWADVSSSLHRSASGEPEYFMTTVVDITTRKAAEDRLQHQVTTDDLTGATSRRRFFELAQGELKRAVRHGEPLTIAFIDVDHLKNVNDSRGHAAGDGVLIAFVDVCQKCIREIDVLARLGGDEFALLMPATTCAQALATIGRVSAALKADIASVPEHTPTTISAGIAGLSDESETLDALLRRADRALYRAKDAGRDRIVVDAHS